MEETRNVQVDDDLYKIPVWLSFLCINGVPFAHFNNFKFIVGNASIMMFNNIEILEMEYECPDYLRDYIKKNFKKFNSF